MIHISNEIKLALKMFNLNIPFVESDLKRSFRSLIKKHHPDVNNNDKASGELTIKIGKNYELLKGYTCIKIDSDIPFDLLKQWEKEDLDITNIYDRCPTCKGSKYEKHVISVRVNCPSCNSTGFILLKCKYCDDGVFTTRKGFKVQCKACKDNGLPKGIWKKVPCRDCNPNFRFRLHGFMSSFFDIGYTYVDKYVDKPCSHCGGRGKIKVVLFNPVIKKGSILK